MQGLKIAIGMVAAFASAPAQAENLKFLVNQTHQPITTGVQLVLDGESGATVAKITLKKRTLIVATFTASCMASGATNSGVSAQIAVKLEGRPSERMPPSNDLPLCRVSPSGSVWETTSIVGGMEMPAGTHRISVFATPFNFAEGTIGATALRIED